MLPLDLHVLGLPLAFILSQDQTLHRCFVNIRPNNSNVRPRPRFSRSNSIQDSRPVFFDSFVLYQKLTNPTLVVSPISSSPQYFNELLMFQRNPRRDTSFCLSYLPKRLQIYNCFYSRQAFLKKKDFFSKAEKTTI